MRVEREITTNPLARVNPLVEQQIQILETDGNLESAFTPDEIEEIGHTGRDEYLADLYRTRQSIAKEGLAGGE